MRRMVLERRGPGRVWGPGDAAGPGDQLARVRKGTAVPLAPVGYHSPSYGDGRRGPPRSPWPATVLRGPPVAALRPAARIPRERGPLAPELVDKESSALLKFTQEGRAREGTQRGRGRGLERCLVAEQRILHR